MISFFVMLHCNYKLFLLLSSGTPILVGNSFEYLLFQMWIVFFNVSCLARSDIGGIQIITYSILLDCKAFVQSEYWTSKGIVKHMIHWPVLSFLTRSIDDIDSSNLRAFLPTPKYNCFAVHIRCNNFIVD